MIENNLFLSTCNLMKKTYIIIYVYNIIVDNNRKVNSTLYKIARKEQLHMIANEKVRAEAKARGVKHWQIAAHIGVSELTFMRWLRFPLPEDKEKKIMEAIKELSEEKENA